MRIRIHVAATTMVMSLAIPALAGGGFRAPAHGSATHHPQLHQPRPHGNHAGAPAQTDSGRFRSQPPAHTGSRVDQRPDPNLQNPYRPMYSLDATNPGEPHPYFRTRKDGFGYPASRSSAVYLGNGLYVFPALDR